LISDLIVGAPYGGVDYKGAVYIYQGDSNGILPQYSQKIDARSVSNTLMTFGYSVKGGMDQDNNEYPGMTRPLLKRVTQYLGMIKPLLKCVT
jgi:integrin alpha 9